MKSISKKWSMALTLGIALVVGAAFTTDSGDWDVPAEFEKMENPIASDDASLKAGKALWTLHCKSCHGKYGEGDGPKADGLETFPGDFTSDEFLDQSDGAMFYKSKFGRDEMPEYSKKIPDDDDIWHLVNYMRSMGE